MQYETITSAAALEEFCAALRTENAIAFDTEFVSEDTFRPQLCLIQVAISDRLAIIDPLEIEDVSPFWKALTEGQHITVAHAAREEFLFCWRSNSPKVKLVPTGAAARYRPDRSTMRAMMFSICKTSLIGCKNA